ncbi:hypothetical protein [Micromonospora aurantiaca (nom. illeg.)]|uniref:hypothetical protein n=1 Tax=Micromonospora aurantiaca (nom. illeg.) TaxID=47850 RepID=UPI0033E60ACB
MISDPSPPDDRSTLVPHSKTRTATILIVTAAAVFALAALLALVDGFVSGRAFAIGAVGLAVATAALAINARCLAGGLAVTVERAPRDQFWKGYEARGEDARGDLDEP